MLDFAGLQVFPRPPDPSCFESDALTIEARYTVCDRAQNAGEGDGAATAEYKDGRDAFEKTETVSDDGLGPVYNSTSCVSCHQNPVTGSSRPDRRAPGRA